MKKVLIVTYYWPPAGGPGVQRWLKFVKYLKNYGIQPIVYIPENPSYPLMDPSFEKEVPEDIEVISRPILEPYALASLFSKKDTRAISSGLIQHRKEQHWIQKLLLFVRGNFFIPDARKYWIKPSVRFLSAYLEDSGIDTIITTGPPHSLHLIGLNLKKKIKIDWIADFRDPWTQIGYQKELKLTRSSEKKHQRLEHEVLNRADQIITTSFTTRAEFMEKTQRPIEVITNGFDGAPVSNPVLDMKFSISHIGSLLSGRNPETLWKVLAELCKEHADFRMDLRLNFYGALSDEVVATIKKQGLEPYFFFGGYISHTEALRIQTQSQLLLLIEIDSPQTRGIIAGKLFEYLAARRPILAIGPEQWDVTGIIQKTGAGKTFRYDDHEDLGKFILDSYRKYQKNQLFSNSKNIEAFHRKQLTQKLADLIKNKVWESL